MNIIEFEETLVSWRMQKYHCPTIDSINEGFRPVSGKVADFGVAEKDGRYHFYYIERRLQEGTPFYPGNEIYLGHASTADFLDWHVHDPVMLIRPGTWEEAHVWAPSLLHHSGRYVMAYTGINRHISQDIGLAFSDDLFQWERDPRNPISPCKGKDWAFWHQDRISSCRDPHIFEHEGTVWIAYTANTRQGASCIALMSSKDLIQWEDHGPILTGPSEGYEPRLEGGHPQGSLESCNLLQRNGKWYLLVNASIRGETRRNWIFESDRMDAFDFSNRREFWNGAGGIEILKERGSCSLLACFCNTIRLGWVDWSAEKPTGAFITREQLDAWNS